MPIPNFDHQGVLPPFVGADGPGGSPAFMTPYRATSLEVVQRLGFTSNRRQILRHWLAHRDLLRAGGFLNGFQWLDGSFVEEKEPQDLDITIFVYAGPFADDATFLQFMQDNIGTFGRVEVKQNFNLDLFLVDLSGSPEGIIDASRYYLGLFSHRRSDYLWKGMLQVKIDTQPIDALALTLLDALDDQDDVDV